MTNTIAVKCDRFAARCSAEELQLFQQIRPLISDNSSKITTPRDIYPFYIQVLNFARLLCAEETKERKFIKILTRVNEKPINRKGAPQIALNFTPIIDSLQGKDSLATPSITVVNYRNPAQVIEAAEAVDLLSEEGLGRSFGVYIFKSIIQSDSALCLLARNEQHQIIGCVLGTLVNVDSSKVFHLWFCARKANYPIRLIEALKDFENVVTERFDPDYLTLDVDLDNEALLLYEKAGFVKSEEKKNSFSGKPACFMVKELKAGGKVPGAGAVTNAITQQSLQILGYPAGLVCMINYRAKQFFRSLWYR